VRNRSVIAVALAGMIAIPAAAGAQFTTFVQPPPRPADKVVVVGTDTVGRVIDSTAVVTADNMRAWVDSAAGDIVPPRDTIVQTTTVRGFVDGSRAPNTATSLPMLLVLGAGAVGAGALLLRSRA
jgi:hypothetical protein